MTQTFFRDHRSSLLISAILALTFLVYAQALSHDFVNLDDTNHVVQNPQIRSLSPDHIRQIFTSMVQRTYIPLTILSFGVEYHFVGLNPFLYKLNNILLHLLVVFLSFRLGIAMGLGPKAAGAAAFIFALHPMHVESVAWVTERKDVLYSSLYLGAVLSYLRYVQSKRSLDYAASLVLGLLSILAKPMALSLPLILLLCDWLQKRDIRKEDWFNKVPYLLYIVPIASITFLINTGIVGQNPGPGLLLRFWSTAFYLKKFFWPAEFVPQYFPTLPVDIAKPEYWSSVVIVGASVAAFFLCKNRWLKFVFLWYILSIFFILNFDYGRVVQMVADRYMYLPSLGFCFLIGYGVDRITGSKSFSHSAVRRLLLTCVAGAALFLCVKTYFQIGIWKDSMALWTYTIQKEPSSYIAFNNRGRIYERQRQWQRALADYQQTVRLNPNYEKGYKNMGVVYEGLGNVPAAIEAYSKAIQIKPNYSAAYNNRGLLLEAKGDLAAALSDYTKAVQSDPRYVLGYTNRGALLIKMGKIEQALSDLTLAIRLDPGNAQAYKNRAVCYVQLNLLYDALRDCQRAVALNRSDVQASEFCSAIQKKIGG